ncbi:hypothetical protein V6N13_083404 [Hibiscus sabdariffa]|uniref:Uncharacterized protein n=1 Tax=Hibiscus sabdariffa TaxID=183260 RepID=A0ABR2SYJ9_9ROSI
MRERTKRKTVWVETVAGLMVAERQRGPAHVAEKCAATTSVPFRDEEEAGVAAVTRNHLRQSQILAQIFARRRACGEHRLGTNSERAEVENLLPSSSQLDGNMMIPQGQGQVPVAVEGRRTE